MNDDLISRKETVRFIREKINLSTFMQRSVDKADKACKELCERIEKEVPTIEPERKKGEWIKQNPMVDTEECSECGYNILDEEFETPFCPYCGADMTNGIQSSDKNETD